MRQDFALEIDILTRDILGVNEIHVKALGFYVPKHLNLNRLSQQTSKCVSEWDVWQLELHLSARPVCDLELS